MNLLMGERVIDAKHRSAKYVSLSRVLVAGSSGAGKTTWARQIAAALDLPQVEIDSLRHGPGWVERPAFVTDVAKLAAEDRWVTEWQNSRTQHILADQLGSGNCAKIVRNCRRQGHLTSPGCGVVVRGIRPKGLMRLLSLPAGCGALWQWPVGCSQ